VWAYPAYREGLVTSRYPEGPNQERSVTPVR
jgi:hypothetical protein